MRPLLVLALLALAACGADGPPLRSAGPAGGNEAQAGAAGTGTGEGVATTGSFSLGLSL